MQPEFALGPGPGPLSLRAIVWMEPGGRGCRHADCSQQSARAHGGGAAMAVLLAAYMLSAIRTEHYWHDDVSFFSDAWKSRPVIRLIASSWRPR